MPAHGQVSAKDPNMIWDQNHGRYIQKPGTELPYDLAKGGFMQTAGNQNAYSDYLQGLTPDYLPPDAGLDPRAQNAPLSSVPSAVDPRPQTGPGSQRISAPIDPRPSSGAGSRPTAPINQRTTGAVNAGGGVSDVGNMGSQVRSGGNYTGPSTANTMMNAGVNQYNSGSDRGQTTTMNLNGSSGPTNRSVKTYLSDVDPRLSEWNTDPNTGWTAPTGGNQAFPNIQTGLNWGENDFGFTAPTGRGNIQTATLTPDQLAQATNGMPHGNAMNPYDDENWDVPDVDLGQMPTMSSGWEPGFESNFFNRANSTRNQLNDLYNFQTPNMEAALNNLGQVPKPTSQGVDQFEQLQFLLSGQGYKPDVVSKMKANAADSLAGQNAARMSAGKMAAQRAGLGDSGISVAMADQAARDNAAGLNQANNQIDIQNAMQGMQNMVTGSGMELNRQQTNQQQANLMALQAAQMMFQAMQQNTANSQQANQTNNQNQMNQRMTNAGQQANVLSNAQSQFGNATLNQAANANQQNAANAFNWNLNQANMNNNNRQFNSNQRFNKWNTGVNATVSLHNNTQPAAYTQQGTQTTTQQQPIGAAVV